MFMDTAEHLYYYLSSQNEHLANIVQPEHICRLDDLFLKNGQY